MKCAFQLMRKQDGLRSPVAVMDRHEFAQHIKMCHERLFVLRDEEYQAYVDGCDQEPPVSREDFDFKNPNPADFMDSHYVLVLAEIEEEGDTYNCNFSSAPLMLASTFVNNFGA